MIVFGLSHGIVIKRVYLAPYQIEGASGFPRAGLGSGHPGRLRGQAQKRVQHVFESCGAGRRQREAQGQRPLRLLPVCKRPRCQETLKWFVCSCLAFSFRMIMHSYLLRELTDR